MRRSPSIALSLSLPDDVDVYLVLDDFGARLGRAWRETSEEDTDRVTVVKDLVGGQYSDPFRVVAFNNLGTDICAGKQSSVAVALVRDATNRLLRSFGDE